MKKSTIGVVLIAIIIFTIVSYTGAFQDKNAETNDLPYISAGLVHLAMELRNQPEYESEYGLFYGDGWEYTSQIGLQGKVFSMFPETISVKDMANVYKWLIAGLLGIVITLICYGIYKKYNLTFAIVFYLVTLLSPWVIGLSTNLYWVEFTWFLPMLFGLYCANHIDSRKARMISYIGVMISIAIKSACGYEFMSTIMLSSIVFLLADFTVELIKNKDKEKIKQLFQVIFIMGIFALAGFVLVLLWHGYIRGNGSIFEGLKRIYYTDVLRRTLGGDASKFQAEYSASLNAPIIKVLWLYLNFQTPLITGVHRRLFIPMIALSVLILTYGFFKKKGDNRIIALFFWMGAASVSWFVLGKAHSYIHTFLNFVMWYFGFMQIIFYIVIEWGLRLLKTFRKLLLKNKTNDV